MNALGRNLSPRFYSGLRLFLVSTITVLITAWLLNFLYWEISSQEESNTFRLLSLAAVIVLLAAPVGNQALTCIAQHWPWHTWQESEIHPQEGHQVTTPHLTTNSVFKYCMQIVLAYKYLFVKKNITLLMSVAFLTPNVCSHKAMLCTMWVMQTR